MYAMNIECLKAVVNYLVIVLQNFCSYASVHVIIKDFRTSVKSPH